MCKLYFRRLSRCFKNFVYAPFESRLNRVVNDYKEEDMIIQKNTFKKETNNVKAIITITQQILGLL